MMFPPLARAGRPRLRFGLGCAGKLTARCLDQTQNQWRTREHCSHCNHATVAGTGPLALARHRPRGPAVLNGHW
jgi:hypothetical protein